MGTLPPPSRARQPSAELQTYQTLLRTRSASTSPQGFRQGGLAEAMMLAESILEDTFHRQGAPALLASRRLLAGRARNALAVGDGPPAEPRPARRADHLRPEGPSQERAGRVHPGGGAARQGARRQALPRPRARLDPRVPPAVARAPAEGLHPRADRRAGAHVDRAPAGGPAPERRPAERARAAAREGARGAAHAARVPGRAPPGTRGHAAAARGPADAPHRAPATRRHSGAPGEAPRDARRADRGDRGGGRHDRAQ